MPSDCHSQIRWEKPPSTGGLSFIKSRYVSCSPESTEPLPAPEEIRTSSKVTLPFLTVHQSHLRAAGLACWDGIVSTYRPDRQPASHPRVLTALSVDTVPSSSATL